MVTHSSTDMVERLREFVAMAKDVGYDAKLLEIAADEIERLRACSTDMVEHLREFVAMAKDVGYDAKLLEIAADEIERLRASLTTASGEAAQPVTKADQP